MVIQFLRLPIERLFLCRPRNQGDRYDQSSFR